MSNVRFIDVQSRPTEFLDFTSLTLEEFQTLVPPFEESREMRGVMPLSGSPRPQGPCLDTSA
jgi:hypothetical protein